MYTLRVVPKTNPASETEALDHDNHSGHENGNLSLAEKKHILSVQSQTNVITVYCPPSIMSINFNRECKLLIPLACSFPSHFSN
jgi:hypothetical protein